ncbi:MAG: ATP-binding protein, partial [Thermoguttaceae bacterium]|nr:ATP-binding protein [Thermoguttaceae bacterium]
HETGLADQFLKTIVLHSKRLYALVQDVLSLSNLESNPVPEKDQFKNVSLYDSLCLATSYCEEAARKKFITIDVEQPKDDDNAPVIPDMMEQAFINLIDNAIKYSDASESEPKKISIAISSTAQHSLKIDFIDEGSGIPVVHQDRVFERFYRVDPSRSKESGGTGLGLAIVKHIVQIHHGSVSVKNNPDRGCTFTIYLPKCR